MSNSLKTCSKSFAEVGSYFGICYWLTAIALILFSYYLVSVGVYHEISPYMRPAEKITAVFNSNQLFLPYLYQDLFLHHAPFKEWILPTVPYLFPDGLIFFILISLFSHIQTAVLLSNISLLILYYLLIVSLGTKVTEKASQNLFRFSALLCLFLGSGHLRDHEILLPLWSSHFGSTIIVYLFNLILILKILEKKSVKSMVLLSVITFVTSLSDPFFFVLFTGSIFGGFLFLNMTQKINSKFILSLFLLIAISGFLGFLSNSYDWLHLHIASFFEIESFSIKTVPQPTFHFTFQTVETLYRIILQYARYSPVVVIVSTGIVCFGIKNLFFFSQSTKACPQSPHLKIEAIFTIICVTFAILVTIISSIFIDKDLLRPNFASLRHFQPSILLPTFLCVPILLSQSTRIIHFFNRYYSYLLVILISCLVLFQPFVSPEKIINFYPPLTHCIDHYARIGKLQSKNGLAQYWASHDNDVLSKENINIVPVSYGKPYNWMGTKQAYKNKKFHFVIAREPTFSQRLVTHQWGIPDAILVCPNASNYYIFLYNKGFYIDNLKKDEEPYLISQYHSRH